MQSNPLAADQPVIAAAQRPHAPTTLPAPRDRLIAKRVVEQFLREFLDSPTVSAEDVFPRLAGRLDISDELFKRWQQMPRRRS